MKADDADTDDWVVVEEEESLYNDSNEKGLWQPKADVILTMFKKLSEGGPLDLVWTCPGRRSPESQDVPEVKEEEMEVDEEEGKEEEICAPEASAFDFDETMSDGNSKLTPRRTPGGNVRTPRTAKRVARMDNIMDSLRREQIQRAAEREAARKTKGSPSAGRGRSLNFGSPVGARSAQGAVRTSSPGGLRMAIGNIRSNSPVTKNPLNLNSNVKPDSSAARALSIGNNPESPSSPVCNTNNNSKPPSPHAGLSLAELKPAVSSINTTNISRVEVDSKPIVTVMTFNSESPEYNKNTLSFVTSSMSEGDSAVNVSTTNITQSVSSGSIPPCTASNVTSVSTENVQSMSTVTISAPVVLSNTVTLSSKSDAIMSSTLNTNSTNTKMELSNECSITPSTNATSTMQNISTSSTRSVTSLAIDASSSKTNLSVSNFDNTQHNTTAVSYSKPKSSNSTVSGTSLVKVVEKDISRPPLPVLKMSTLFAAKEVTSVSGVSFSPTVGSTTFVDNKSFPNATGSVSSLTNSSDGKGDQIGSSSLTKEKPKSALNSPTTIESAKVLSNSMESGETLKLESQQTPGIVLPGVSVPSSSSISETVTKPILAPTKESRIEIIPEASTTTVVKSTASVQSSEFQPPHTSSESPILSLKTVFSVDSTTVLASIPNPAEIPLPPSTSSSTTSIASNPDKPVPSTTNTASKSSDLSIKPSSNKLLDSDPQFLNLNPSNTATIQKEDILSSSNISCKEAGGGDDDVETETSSLAPIRVPVIEDISSIPLPPGTPPPPAKT